MFPRAFILLISLVLPLSLAAQEDSPVEVAPAAERLAEEELIKDEAVRTDVDTNEDPEARRRAEREAETDAETEAKSRTFEYDLYASVRIHAINNFDPEKDQNETNFGDGASRVGASAEYHFSNGWNLFGRIESGFDVLDTFTQKAQNDDGGAFRPRLHNFGVESDKFYFKYGKSWSVYYKVAGAADRFSIFGGSAAGVYNAGTDGGATGTGRADEALQTRMYIDFESWTTIKPFNLNVQYQQDQPIPQLKGHHYDQIWSLSAWQETEKGLGVGIAWHRAFVDEITQQLFKTSKGLDDDAQAIALAFKTGGDRWLASLVFARLENIETTDEGVYFDGKGTELFAQWEFRNHWWLVGGGNYLTPDDDQEQAGEYEIFYTVLGLRYTFDSFNRMVYAEFRNDHGKLANGQERDNEFTLGVRWDFGY